LQARFLEIGSAPLPVGIQATLLKHASKSLPPPRAQLYQSLFISSEMSKEWKLAMVTSVFKKGKSTNVSNYRPICLTSLCCELTLLWAQEMFVIAFYIDKIKQNLFIL